MIPGHMAQAPLAPRKPTPLVAHDDERIDDWYWLRERENPDVLDYLTKENEYTAAAMQHTLGLQESLFQEIKSRIQETDLSPPQRKGEWWYYSRTVEGLQYPIHCRKHGTLEAAEEIMLDQNALAEGHDFFALGAFSVSPDHRMVAYSTDFEGDEIYTLRIRDLTTGIDLTDEVPGVSYGVEWGNDNATLFYTTLNDAMRPWRLHRHKLATTADEDKIVYQEDDEAFYLGITKSKSDRFLFLCLESKVTTETHILDANTPDGEFAVVEPRHQDVEYAMEHQGDRFLIVTNADGAENFKLMEAPLDAPARDNWTDVIPHRNDVRLSGIEVFADFVAIEERAEGMTRLRVCALKDLAQDGGVVDQPESVYTVGVGSNFEYDSKVLRFDYTSLVTPQSVVDIDMETGKRTLVKQQPVLGGYDPADYVTSREWATAPDGVQVPISLVYRKGLSLDGTAPMLLYGYGSYEASMDPTFRSTRLSLIDRGFVYAIAHIRGGGEMGRRWYEDGKLLKKKNTFTDFVASAEHLIAQGYSSADRIVARGGSAGGLLMGAIANMRPDLFEAVVAEVPFVDALTTILDETLPLTVIEWEEWGNPVKDREVYMYMKSYAPYDNVEAKNYPKLLVRGGLNDPRVSYWEPAKWVAKLRVTKTDDNTLLLKTDMGAGHMGPSGRYDAWRDEAFVQSFILDAVGITE
jgi:oligopeptidase B